MRTKYATPVLIACTLFMTIVAGTGTYEHLFGIPKMLSSPAAFAEATNNTQGQPTRFWIPLHVLSLLTLIGSLVLNWKNPGRKKLILGVFIGYVYISVVSIFFARQLLAFGQITDAAEFSQQTKQWLLLSWHRPLIGLISSIALMTSISRPAAATTTYHS